ncbi:MAG: hypothetical protein LPK19_14375 [Hymenobacteraceae bacterium]|nr:hypothetical protein [Hymenobacteraceae bacterium]MDX5397417.1 hypothetical protein [Hymenobacteraceae bacterium]MDX5513495.1 hypothetical protein [Hymenobacteraceae bacterium]
MNGFLSENKSVIIFKDKSLQIVFDQQDEILFVTWQGRVTEEEVKAGYLKLIAFMKTQQVRKCLVDSRKREMESSLDPNKLFNLLFPNLQPYLHEQLFIASVLSVQSYMERGDTFSVDRPLHYQNYNIIINRFIDYDKALQWLRQVDVL